MREQTKFIENIYKYKYIELSIDTHAGINSKYTYIIFTMHPKTKEIRVGFFHTHTKVIDRRDLQEGCTTQLAQCSPIFQCHMAFLYARARTDSKIYASLKGVDTVNGWLTDWR